MTEPREIDELVQAYRAASGQDERRPGPRVREAVLAHARVVAEATTSSGAAVDIVQSGVGRAGRGAANWPSWRMSALAGVAVIGLTALLILQFDRAAPGHDQVASVMPSSPSAAPSAAKVASSLASSAASAAAARASDQAEVPTLVAQASEQTNRQKSRPRVRTAAPSNQSVTVAAAPAAPTPFPADAAAAPAAPSNAAETAATVVASAKTADSARVEPRPRMSAPAVEVVAAGPPPAAPSAGTANRASAMPRAAPALAGDATAPPAAVAEPAARPAVSTALVVVPSGRPPIFGAAESGNATLIAELIAAGAQVNARHAMGRTPLMLAAINGKREAVKKLLELGADRSLVDQDGASALDHARRLGWVEIARDLEVTITR